MGKKTHFANTLCKYRKMGGQEYMRAHTKTFYDESSASTWELSGKELLRGGG